MPTLSPDDLSACRAMLRTGSRSFHAASLLLPRRVRDPATALYAFCRAADDAVDGGGDPRAALDGLRERLDRIYAGRPRAHPVDRGFAAVVDRFGLPRVLPEALFEGFAWDAERRTYAGPADLDAYAVRVAGTVGLMMALLMGRRDEACLSRAADLGIAMQLTNIARDVGEDARAGRLYLPLGWLAEAGIDPAAFLARPASSPGLDRVVARLLARAEDHYRRAETGIAALPPACRPSMHAARLVYREIGRQVAADGHDPVARRAVVPSRRKAALCLAAVLASLRRGPPVGGPAAPAARTLVAAVAAHPPPRPATGAPERLIEIITALEQRDRARRQGVGALP